MRWPKVALARPALRQSRWSPVWPVLRQRRPKWRRVAAALRPRGQHNRAPRRPTLRQSRWSPLWPVLSDVARHRLPRPVTLEGRRPPHCAGLSGDPTRLAAVWPPRLPSDRLPRFPDGRLWPSQCAAATIPVAPARSLVVFFARSRRCSHRRRVLALASALTSWFSRFIYGRF